MFKTSQSRAFGNQFQSCKTSSKIKALSKIKAGNKFGKDHLHHLTQWFPGVVEWGDGELDLRGRTSHVGTPAPFWLAVCPQASFLTFLGLNFLSCESKITTVYESQSRDVRTSAAAPYVLVILVRFLIFPEHTSMDQGRVWKIYFPDSPTPEFLVQ